MKHILFPASFLPFYILCLLTAASCSLPSNTASLSGLDDAEQIVQASTPVDAEGEAVMDKIILSFNGRTLTATLADNPWGFGCIPAWTHFLRGKWKHKSK